MNFDYDLMTWIVYFIGAFALCLGMFFSGQTLLGVKLKDVKKYNILLLILLSIIMIFNTLIFDNIVKIFGILVILLMINKLVLKKDIRTSFIYSIVIYFCILVSEVTISVIFTIFVNIFNLDMTIMTSGRTISMNIAVALLAYFYARLIRYKVKSIINKLNNSNIVYIIIVGIVTIFVMLSTMYSLYINNWNLNYKLVLHIIIFIGYIGLFLTLLKQYLNSKEISYKYELLNDYLKNSAEIIEKYSSTIHKYKNNLIAIKGYIENNKKEAEKYIDTLLGDFNQKKYNWFNKINYIHIDSMRYLAYYKLSKAETENLKITVDVSKDIKKYKNGFLTTKESNILSEIIGEYFDNAIYASSESKEKELNLMLYDENEKLVFTVANTFKGEINLNIITKNGYTTKGKGHGLGLYDIDKTVRKNEWLSVSYELLENYFVAKLIINKK